MNSTSAKFAPGALVRHKLFEYRGVVIDVDPHFQDTSECYGMMAKSRPPKERPWYHVLVDGSDVQTYVAERNLETDESGRPIDHPEVATHFATLGDGATLPRQKGN